MAWVQRSGPIADALVAWLNQAGQDWNGQFSATRTWAPDDDFTQLTNLTVEAVPIQITPEELQTRGQKIQEYHTLLAFRQRYATPGNAANAAIPNAWVDGLMQTVESVANALENLEIHYENQPAGTHVYVVKQEIDLSLLPEALKGERSFLAFIEITWKEQRPR
ncbi:MAG TPA: hypothetical protein VKS79_21220 [Gemmataceae bacterium]|nr:hypothetical protein [Gemmataceae bacterium]